MISFAGFVIHFLGCSRKGMVKKEYSKSENEIDDHAKILKLHLARPGLGSALARLD